MKSRKAISRFAEGLRSFDEIQELKDPQIQNELKKLSLHGNRLQNLDFFPPLPNLTELVLSSNDLKFLSGELGTLPLLNVLDVSSNRLTSFIGMPALPSLQRLIAAHNPISNLTGIEGCRQLELLDVRDGNLLSMNALQPLSRLPHLKDLALCLLNGDQTNPVCAAKDYPHMILNLVPHLQILDGQATATYHAQIQPQLQMPKFQEAVDRFHSRVKSNQVAAQPTPPPTEIPTETITPILEAVTSRLATLHQQARIDQLESQIEVLTDLAEKMYKKPNNNPEFTPTAQKPINKGPKEKAEPMIKSKAGQLKKKHTNPWSDGSGFTANERASKRTPQSSEATSGKYPRAQPESNLYTVAKQLEREKSNHDWNESVLDTSENSVEISDSKDMSMNNNQTEAQILTSKNSKNDKKSVLKNMNARINDDLQTPTVVKCSVSVQTDPDTILHDEKQEIHEHFLKAKEELDQLLAQSDIATRKANNFKKKSFLANALQKMASCNQTCLRKKFFVWRTVTIQVSLETEAKRLVEVTEKREKERLETIWRGRFDALQEESQVRIVELEKQVRILSSNLEQWKESSEKNALSERKLFEELQNVRRESETQAFEISGLRREVERARRNESEARQAEGAALANAQMGQVRIAQLTSNLEAEIAGRQSSLGAKEAQLKAELEVLRHSEQKLKEEISKLAFELSQSEGRARGLEDHIAQLKSINTRQRHEAEQEMASLQQQMTGKLHQLQLKLEETTKHQYENSLAKKAAETENRLTKKTVAELSALVKQQKTQLQLNKEQKIMLEKEKNELQLATQNLERVVKDMREVDSHSEINLNKIIQELQSCVAQGEAKIKELEHESANKAAHLLELSHKYQQAELNLAVKIKMLDDQNTVIAELKKKESDLRGRLERKKMEWGDEREELEAELENYKVEVMEMKVKIDAQAEIESHLQTIILKLKGFADHQNEQSIVDSLLSEDFDNKKIAELHEQIAEKDRALRYVEKEFLGMRKLFDEKERAIKRTHEEENCNLKASLQRLEMQLVTEKDNRRKNEVELKTLSSENQQIKSSFTESQHLLVRAEAEIQSLESQLTALREENLKMKDKLEAMSAIFQQF